MALVESGMQDALDDAGLRFRRSQLQPDRLDQERRPGNGARRASTFRSEVRRSRPDRLAAEDEDAPLGRLHRRTQESVRRDSGHQVRLAQERAALRRHSADDLRHQRLAAQDHRHRRRHPGDGRRRPDHGQRQADGPAGGRHEQHRGRRHAGPDHGLRSVEDRVPETGRRSLGADRRRVDRPARRTLARRGQSVHASSTPRTCAACGGAACW